RSFDSKDDDHERHERDRIHQLPPLPPELEQVRGFVVLGLGDDWLVRRRLVGGGERFFRQPFGLIQAIVIAFLAQKRPADAEQAKRHQNADSTSRHASTPLPMNDRPTAVGRRDEGVPIALISSSYDPSTQASPSFG